MAGWRRISYRTLQYNTSLIVKHPYLSLPVEVTVVNLFPPIGTIPHLVIVDESFQLPHSSSGEGTGTDAPHRAKAALKGGSLLFELAKSQKP
jgi:hypothetical protein